jgi:hypothetical protein
MIRKSGNWFSSGQTPSVCPQVMRKKVDRMRRSQRLIAATVLLALSGALAGCSRGLSNWDPSDLLDFLDTQKKLPGERKPVFPDGVPGLEQGVPKELYKGSAQERLDQQNADAAAAASAPAPEQPKSKHAAKSKDRGNGKPAASTAPAQDTAAAPEADAVPEEDGSTAAVPPAPKPKKIARKRTTAPPPDQPAAQAAAPAPSAQSAQQPQQSAASFPAPLPGGSVSR